MKSLERFVVLVVAVGMFSQLEINRAQRGATTKAFYVYVTEADARSTCVGCECVPLCMCVCVCVCIYLCPVCLPMTCPYRAATPWTNHWEAVQADVFVAIRTSIEFCEMISIYLGYL